jgi:hypothetical protein
MSVSYKVNRRNSVGNDVQFHVCLCRFQGLPDQQNVAVVVFDEQHVNGVRGRSLDHYLLSLSRALISEHLRRHLPSQRSESPSFVIQV